ncbi:MFS transporter, partial [Streptomyces sp. SID11385]|nr:MFS transporter [Streptomyces sp. SID11385]
GLAVVRWIPRGAGAGGGGLDLPGTALLGLAFAAVLLALTEGPRVGWASAEVLGLFAGFALCAALFLTWERRAAHPLVPLPLLLGPGLALAHLGAFLLGAVQFVFYVLIPRLAELPAGVPDARARLVPYGFGVSVTVAGLLLLPGTLMGFPASAAAGRLERRASARLPLAAGLGTSA